MNCEEVKKELEMLQETGKISGIARAHIESCRSCAAEYELIIKVREACARPDVAVPRDFNKKVWDKIGEPAPSLFPGFIFRPAYVLSGAVAVMALFLVLFIGRGGLQKKEIITAKAPVPAVRVQKQNPVIRTAAVKPKPVAGKPVIAAVNVKKETAAAPAPQQEKQEAQENKVSGGGVPVLASGGGTAAKEYHINSAPVQKNDISAAMVEKNEPVLSGPIEIRNNVIRPLSGHGMSVIYRVDNPCSVVVQVYNRKGELIKTVYKGTRAHGVYEEQWMGEDAGGLAVADGVYVVYIKTGLTEQKIKAMVVK
jgi:hypothetical protein